MPLKEATELQSVTGPAGIEDGGCYLYRVNNAGVTAIRVGREAGGAGWFATAEIFKGDDLAFVMPLAQAEHYVLVKK